MVKSRNRAWCYIRWTVFYILSVSWRGLCGGRKVKNGTHISVIAKNILYLKNVRLSAN